MHDTSETSPQQPSKVVASGDDGPPTGDITQAAAPATFNNVEYRASPLSDRDLVELDKWIQAQYIIRARSSLKMEGLTQDDDEYQTEMSIVRREALTITWMSAEGAGMMATIEGTSRVLWHQLRNNHPELGHEDVRRMLTGKESLGIAQQLFRDLDLNPTVKQADAMEKLAARRSAERKKFKRAQKQAKKTRKKQRRTRGR